MSRRPIHLDGDCDVLIAGGGIVGSGVARDAAMRGLRTILVDRNDFAFGTSSRSSRLLHGGLRYLAQGRVGLVREASVEKVVVSRIAPHLAIPLPFIFPTRGGTEWKRWKLSIGVKIYDLLCSGRNLGKSQTLTSAETLAMLPRLNPDHLTGAVRYFDGMTNDARLVLDTLRSAAANGATLANYVSLTTARRDGDAWIARLHDHVTDMSHEVRAKTIVNATGAWTNSFAQSAVKLRVSKGVHLVVDRQRLNLPDAVVMTEGSRVLFAIPWGERVILGTTDTDYTGPLDSPSCEPADIEYILRITNYNFPSAQLTDDDVISTFAGLRPLIADPNGKPSDISRRHEILMPHPGWFDVAGGKLTTYRLMAEQTIDRVIDFAKLKAAKCATDTTELLSESERRFSGIVPPAVTREPVEHFCRNEWAVHLSDIMIRRTSWRYYYRDHLPVAQQVAAWMRELLDWSDDRMNEELSAYEDDGCVTPLRAATQVQHA